MGTATTIATKTRNEIEGERLKEMRQLMGLTSTDVCKATEMNNGQYSRIEQGELSAAKVLPYVRSLFKEWRSKEEEKLKIRLQYFQSLES